MILNLLIQRHRFDSYGGQDFLLIQIIKNRLEFNPYWLATNCGREKRISISHNVCFFNQILGLSRGCGG